MGKVCRVPSALWSLRRMRSRHRVSWGSWCPRSGIWSPGFWDARPGTRGRNWALLSELLKHRVQPNFPVQKLSCGQGSFTTVPGEGREAPLYAKLPLGKLMYVTPGEKGQVPPSGPVRRGSLMTEAESGDPAPTPPAVRPILTPAPAQWTET